MNTPVTSEKVIIGGPVKPPILLPKNQPVFNGKSRSASDMRNELLFSFSHRDSPFGPCPMSATEAIMAPDDQLVVGHMAAMTLIAQDIFNKKYNNWIKDFCILLFCYYNRTADCASYLRNADTPNEIPIDDLMCFGMTADVDSGISLRQRDMAIAENSGEIVVKEMPSGTHVVFNQPLTYNSSDGVNALHFAAPENIRLGLTLFHLWRAVVFAGIQNLDKVCSDTRLNRKLVDDKGVFKILLSAMKPHALEINEDLRSVYNTEDETTLIGWTVVRQ